jgi:hypothetical protein
MLDDTAAILGDKQRVQESTERWKHDTPPSADLASEARKLAESDDAWFVVVKPLSMANSASSGAALKHLAESST